MPIDRVDYNSNIISWRIVPLLPRVNLAVQLVLVVLLFQENGTFVGCCLALQRSIVLENEAGAQALHSRLALFYAYIGRYVKLSRESLMSRSYALVSNLHKRRRIYSFRLIYSTFTTTLISITYPPPHTLNKVYSSGDSLAQQHPPYESNSHGFTSLQERATQRLIYMQRFYSSITYEPLTSLLKQLQYMRYLRRNGSSSTGRAFSKRFNNGIKNYELISIDGNGTHLTIKIMNCTYSISLLNFYGSQYKAILSIDKMEYERDSTLQ